MMLLLKFHCVLVFTIFFVTVIFKYMSGCAIKTFKNILFGIVIMLCNSNVELFVLLLPVCWFLSSAQDGGCSPDPPNTLISSRPATLLSNKVPKILTDGGTVTFRPLIGGHGTTSWVVFSESQVRQFGLWCQVRQVNTNNNLCQTATLETGTILHLVALLCLPTLLMMALHTSH